MSTQRLLIIIIAINLLMGFTDTMYWQINGQQTAAIQNDLNIGIERSTIMQDDDVKWAIQSANQQEETSIGDSLTLGSVIWDTLRNGILPIPYRESAIETTFEEYLYIILNWALKSVMYILIILEILLLAKNRKAS